MVILAELAVVAGPLAGVVEDVVHVVELAVLEFLDEDLSG